MKAATGWVCIGLFVLIFAAALRTIFERKFPFVREIDERTYRSYLLLGMTAAILFIWARYDLHFESLEVAGVKANVGQLQQRVETLSDQMEVFFKAKQIETFDSKNWNEVRTASKSAQGVILEVTLKKEPIPGSLEVFEGVLLMPEQQYKIDGRNVQFPANTNTPEDGLTIKYYPRVPPHS